MNEDFARAAEEIQKRIFDSMKTCRSDPERQGDVRYTQGTADGIRAAIHSLIVEMFGISAVQRSKREALEQRVAQLETANATLAEDRSRLSERLAEVEASFAVIRATGTKVKLRGPAGTARLDA